jgi:serine/threonine protein kinase
MKSEVETFINLINHSMNLIFFLQFFFEKLIAQIKFIFKIERMDQYMIIKILGKGSEGQVLLAENRKTKEEIAIKRMEFSNDKQANQHLEEVKKK